MNLNFGWWKICTGILLLAAALPAPLAGCGPTLAQQQAQHQQEELERQADIERQKQAEIERLQREEEGRRAARQAMVAQGEAAEKAGQTREALRLYGEAVVGALPGSEEETDVLRHLVAVSQRLDPPPALPEEARRHVARGLTAMKMAKVKDDFQLAAAEFRQARQLAPWVADIHYNLALAEEGADRPDSAARSFALYLLAAPDAPDRTVIQGKVYELEFTAERRKKQLQEWVGEWVMSGVQVAATVTDSNAGTERDNYLWEIPVRVLAVTSGGEATLEVEDRYGAQKAVWQGAVTDSGLTAEQPAQSPRPGKEGSRETYVAGPGRLEIVRDEGGYSARFSFASRYITPMALKVLTQDVVYSYSGTIRKE